MNYSKKKNCTTYGGIRTRIFKPKGILKYAVNILIKTAIIIAAAIWLSGGVFQSSADTSYTEKAAVQDTSAAETHSAGLEHDLSKTASYDTCASSDDEQDNVFLNPTDGVLTSSFGTRWGRRHSGIDIGADEGSEIYAAQDGQVIFSGKVSGYGNYIMIDHGSGVQTAYGHCSALVAGVGEKVKKGQLIAYVGSTGNSTGPHLHFEIKIDDEFKNPLDYVVY